MPATTPEGADLRAALEAGDEDAFRELVEALQPSLIRLALVHAPSRAVAEEIVQEAWIAALKGLDGYRGEASLRTWVSTIVINAARRLSTREARSVPFSSLGDEPSVDPARFHSAGPFAGHWFDQPQHWPDPEDATVARELRAVAAEAIAGLDRPQREVIALRDVEGWSGPEVADVLGITLGYQRVLLHRARSAVRQALEDYHASL